MVTHPDLAWLLCWTWAAEYLLLPEPVLAHRGQWTAPGLAASLLHGLSWGLMLWTGWACLAPGWPPWIVYACVGAHLVLTQVPLFSLLALLFRLQSVDRATEQALQLVAQLRAPEMKGVVPALTIGLGTVAFRLQEFTWHSGLVAALWYWTR